MSTLPRMVAPAGTAFWPGSVAGGVFVFAGDVMVGVLLLVSLGCVSVVVGVSVVAVL